MKDKQILVKRDVKDGLPKDINTYHTSWEENGKVIILYANRFDGKEFELQDNNRYAQPDSWYEPTTLLALLEELMEEAGKELPDKDVVSKYADVNSNNFPDQGSGKMCNAAQYEGIIYGAEWMKEKASALLAIKQREIEGLKDKIANWVVQMKAPVVPLPIKQEDIDKYLKDKEEANINLYRYEL